MTLASCRRALFVAAALAAGLAAGCGGGGNAPGPAAIPALSNGSGPTSALVNIKIPPPAATASSSRKPAYISPATESIGIVVTPVGASPFPVVMTEVPGPDCTGSAEVGYSCTITVQALAGSNTLTITTYSLPDGGGSVLSSGTVQESFSAGQSPTPVNVTLSGVIASVVMSITHNDINGNPQVDPNVPVGQSATLNLTAEDASGNAIVGTFATPITVSIPSGGLTLSTDSFPDSSHVTATITWNNPPFYHGAPSSGVDLIAYQNTTQVGSIQLNPTSTVLTFPAGDGTLQDDGLGLGLEQVGTKLYYTTIGPETVGFEGFGTDVGVGDGGNLGVIDLQAGTQTISGALPFGPGGVYVDPTYQGIWVADALDPTGIGQLVCYNNVAGAPQATIPVPDPEASGTQTQPLALTSDMQNNLWFIDTHNQGLGYVPTTGQCTVNADGFRIFRSPAGNSTFTDIATDGTNVWTNDLNNGVVWYASSQDDGVISLGLPDDLTQSDALFTDALDSIDVAGTSGSSNTIVVNIPAGTTSFGGTPTTDELQGIVPLRIASLNSGVNKVLVAGMVTGGGIAYLPLGNPGLAAALGVPNADELVGCVSVAFDSDNLPWSICSDGQYAHLERFMLTDAAWNLFLDTSSVGEVNSYSTIAGVGGGSAATTFTWNCSGVVTCKPTSAGQDRSYAVTASGPGAATVSVTGSDGRTVTQNFTVVFIGPQSIGRRPPSSLEQRLFGKRSAQQLLP